VLIEKKTIATCFFDTCVWVDWRIEFSLVAKLCPTDDDGEGQHCYPGIIRTEGTEQEENRDAKISNEGAGPAICDAIRIFFHGRNRNRPSVSAPNLIG